MNDGYKSRKFWMTVALSCKFTLLLSVGLINQESFVLLESGVVLFFTTGNVSEKFAK